MTMKPKGRRVAGAVPTSEYQTTQQRDYQTAQQAATQPPEAQPQPTGAPDPARAGDPDPAAASTPAPDYGRPPASTPPPAPPMPTAPTATRPAIDPPLAKPQRTRLGGLWVALTSGAVILLLLLIFILENGQKVDISFFGAHGHLPLGIALLMAAIFGVLAVVIPGAGRMIQLRLLAKRHRKQVAALPPQQVQPGYGQQAGGAPADPAFTQSEYGSPTADPAAPHAGG